jgi:predicted DNA-binding transcriptional regulator AlpA
MNLIGIADIAARLGVERATVDIWRYRGILPEPTAIVARTPMWTPAVIDAWAKETGRA